MLINLGDDVPAGMNYLGAELAGGRSGVWCGRGPAGFALISAALRARPMGAGSVIALSLTPEQLKRLHARIGELLGVAAAPAAIDGIRIGDTPKGDAD